MQMLEASPGNSAPIVQGLSELRAAAQTCRPGPLAARVMSPLQDIDSENYTTRIHEQPRLECFCLRHISKSRDASVVGGPEEGMGRGESAVSY